MLSRRRFLQTVSAGFLVVPVFVEAQQTKKVPRLGILMHFPPEQPVTRTLLDAFIQGLRELGYVEGQNIVIEYRSAQGKVERFPDLVAELEHLKVDLIVLVGGTPVARAAKQVTSTIPIVAPAVGDPVGDGLAASLARAGGNITGSTFLGPELVAKRLQLFKEAVPGVSRVAALWHPGAYGERTMRGILKETEVAARALGVQLQFVDVRGPNEFDRAFSLLIRQHADSLITLPSPMLFQEHRRIVDLATKSRLPAMYQTREFVDAGGLMAYGANIPDLFRRAAPFVDKIVRGARPADLPIEQPTKYELLINLKTAKALGLTIPQSVLARADQIIE